ncbi:MAG: response regulator, partial [Planctomycetia bacterium]
QIYQAGNGQEGLKVLEENWVDLVIADINMPVMNGLEMIDEIQSDDSWHNLPIVVISTEGSQTRIDNLHEIGVEFIHKPFTPEAIRNVLINKLGISHV